MKLSKNILLAAIALAPLTMAAQGNQAYKGRIAFDLAGVKRANDSVYVTLKANLRNIDLKSRAALTLTPALLSQDQSSRADGKTVVLGGRNRVIMAKRGQFEARGAKKGTKVQRHVNGEGDILDLSFAVPFSSWMSQANVVVMEATTGCANCELGDNIYSLTGKLFRDYQPEYQLTYVAPPVERLKVREDKFVARFNFKVAKYDLLPELGNNRYEFARVDSVTRNITENPDVVVKNVRVDGYASPEGDFASNETLSRNRANAFLQFLMRTYGINTSSFKVYGHGEDWAGLQKAVERYPMEGQNEVLNIIAIPDVVARKNSLKKLNGGQTYANLLQNVYPPLRRTEYQFRYEVRDFTLEEARERIKTNPSHLSQAEMYMVAQSYPEGSVERRHAFDTALRLYPTDNYARINALASDLLNSPTRVSLDQFQNLPVSAEYYNALGVYYAQNREFEKAVDCFQKAGNLPAAVHNLQEVKQAME